MRLDEKRLELLRMKQAQLEKRRQSDPALASQIEEIRQRLSTYEVAPVAEPQPSSGLIQLGKKNEDGSLVRVKSGTESAGAHG